MCLIISTAFVASARKSVGVFSDSSAGSPSCECKSASNSTGSNTALSSPSLDAEVKEMILDQNKQLQQLRKQVEQLLQYQEKLQGRIEEKEKSHEATQTSFFYSGDANCGNLQKQLPQTSNSCTPVKQSTQERGEFTLTFRDLQLETIMEQSQNSPQSSFLVNMQEYQDFSEDQFRSGESPSCVTVLEQVHRLLAQANTSENNSPVPVETAQERYPNHNVLDNPVRRFTVQRIRELGVSFVSSTAAKYCDSLACSRTTITVNSHFSAGPRNSIYYPRYHAGSQNQLWNTRKETDQSIEMQRLAEKYLGESTSREYNKVVDHQPVRNLRTVEMSLSSQQYLERYGLQH